MQISQNLKSMRDALGKTQEEVAQAGGFTQGLYTKWENGTSIPGADNLIKLADCFGCSIDYLVGREAEDGVIAVNDKLMLNDREQKLLKNFRTLPYQKQEKVIGYIAGIQEE
ncbi:MAG: helix-turn-helix domain-containing protein [Clostridia bacterium]|nr:helix-turn-helix domain-containing protein [Clostridia bacterium]